MEEEQLANEIRYYTLMHHVRRMLRAGLITGEEFSGIGSEARRRYRPAFGGLLAEKEVLEMRVRERYRRTDDGGEEGSGHEDQQD